MFKALPHLQACQRGITVAYAPIADADLGDRVLAHSVALNNGKTLHIYLEKDCTELRPTADALKKLQAY